MKAIFKVHIEGDSKASEPIHIIGYRNNRISLSLYGALLDAVHDVADVWNGKKYWRETYYKFNHNGKRYEQYDSGKGAPCEGCIFNDVNLLEHKDGLGCQHPHYINKGKCDHPYRLVKED